jgi:hypothetical protein
LLQKGFRISQLAKINVRGLDLHPNVANPELLNEYLRVYELSKADGVLLTFPNPNASHVALVDAPIELRFSGYRYLNPYAADAKAASLLAGDLSVVDSTTLNKLVIPSVPPDTMLHPRVVPVPFPKHWGSENQLLRAILHTKGMIKTRGLSYEKLWAEIVKGDISKKVDVLAITLQFNMLRQDALVSGEEFVYHVGVIVPVNEIFPKNLQHVRDELRNYARATAVHNKNELSPKPSIAFGEVPAAMFAPTVAAAPLVSVAPSSIVPAALSLPLTNGNGGLNTSPGLQQPPPATGKTRKAQASGRAAKAPRVEDGSGKGLCARCPYQLCGARKGHRPNCVFELWSKETNQPEILEPRPQGRGKETDRQFLLRLFTQHEAAIVSRIGV